MLPKESLIAELFGTNKVQFSKSDVLIDGRNYPVIDDVIILNKEATEILKKDVVQSFGLEWLTFPSMKEEHFEEFDKYFDLIQPHDLENKCVADFGCGMGRWSFILLQKASPRLLIMYDYSDAIFAARKLIGNRDNVLYFKGDIEYIPFAPGCIDFAYCLGVLHHIPSGIETSYAKIATLTPRLLCYLYYNFDNRGRMFKALFGIQDCLRRATSKVRNAAARTAISHFLTLFAYYPFVTVGHVVNMLGFTADSVPLSFYRGFSYDRIRQDAYDRFFTKVEYRMTREQIRSLVDKYYSRVVFSDQEPFWHFLGER